MFTFSCLCACVRFFKAVIRLGEGREITQMPMFSSVTNNLSELCANSAQKMLICEPLENSHGRLHL